MDVSGWTIEQKMRLPDWCFGQRQLVMAGGTASGAGTKVWDISELALPQQICVWQMGIIPRHLSSASDYVRIGFNSTLPTSEAEMDTSIPLLEYFGWTLYSPPRIIMPATGTELWEFFLRRGMDTEGKKLTVEVACVITKISLIVYMLYSELPSSMISWLSHNQ